MKHTLDYYCARVEHAKGEYMRNPRTLNALLDAIDELRNARSNMNTKNNKQLTLNL